MKTYPHKYYGKYEMVYDEVSFEPFAIICGKYISPNFIADSIWSFTTPKEEIKQIIIERYGEDVYQELKETIKELRM